MELVKDSEALRDLYNLVLTTPMDTYEEANMLNYVYKRIEATIRYINEVIEDYSRHMYEFEGKMRVNKESEKYALECARDMLEEI